MVFNTVKKESLEESIKIQVTFNKIQIQLIDDSIGAAGSTRSEVVRTIVANYFMVKK